MYQPRAYPPRDSTSVGNRRGSHDLRKTEQQVAQNPSPSSRVDSVRSRLPTSSRERSRSNPRTRSRSSMYSSDSAGADSRYDDVSAAQLQEMREKSKLLRDQVLSVQRTVQSKEGQLQRLKNERLPAEEVTQEVDKLSRLQDRINVQEARLRKLRETKGKIQQQVIINSAMVAELDGLKNIVSNKEKEIMEMDQLINQLNTRLQQSKVESSSRNSKNNHYLHRIDKLKQEMMAHKRVTETVQGKFSSQREAVHSKKEEMKKVDIQIAELWRKLQQAKASQQQSSQKSATAIAAVGPFEHKPSAPTENRSSPPIKPQEIDIKLIERNGGSGQSSPSASADERELHSMRSLKPPIPLPEPDRHSPKSMTKPAVDLRPDSSKLRQRDAATGNEGKNVSAPARANELANKADGKVSPPNLKPSKDSKPQRQQNILDSRKAAPRPRHSSPPKPAAGEMRVEKGPVHQLKPGPQANLTHSLSDPSLVVGKTKNFNTKPRPFEKLGSSASPPISSSSQPSVDSVKVSEASSPSRVPEQSGKAEVKNKVYPATPIMGRQQLNSSGGNNIQQRQSNSSDVYGQHKPTEQGPTKGARYATRSQISDTYMQQVDKDRLEQYRKDMEKAVRGVSSNKPNQTVVEDGGQKDKMTSESAEVAVSVSPPVTVSSAPASVTTPTTVSTATPTSSTTTTSTASPSILIPPMPPQSSPPTVTPPTADVQSQGETTPSLTVLEAGDRAPTGSSPEIPSSEDEKLDYVEIYAPHDSAYSHVKPIIKKKSADQPDGLIRADNARFHPLVILLDAALNGTMEEVKHVLPRVPDPSASNDEGITALHNAICAGHLDIVQTLVEFGVDVNAVDTDGWTPLHCAASCNNEPVVEYLISRGACILATTYSDNETALEKCEMDEEGYDGTSRCLQNKEMRLGVEDPVYCVYDYNAESADELNLHVNDKLTVLRRGDKEEQDWWWAKCGDREGYVAKNLLAFSPRVLPNNNTPKE